MKGCSDFKETNKEDDNNDEELRPDSVKLDDDKKISLWKFALPKKNYLHIKGDNQKGFNQFLSRFEITLKFYLLGNRILRSCFDCSHNSGAAQTVKCSIIREPTELLKH
ncbi:uncharacterized protein OCT59_001183 [Rhizophagus irregularis]|uniref:uncharacterized protein n=1 Tax=Rhizophagus irregularis TaxID=588596 RepID=UPI00331A4DC7|nr:hypothetical protein OCT59_001183 [Rhizophagus irregularis]